MLSCFRFSRVSFGFDTSVWNDHSWNDFKSNRNRTFELRFEIKVNKWTPTWTPYRPNVWCMYALAIGALLHSHNNASVLKWRRTAADLIKPILTNFPLEKAFLPGMHRECHDVSDVRIIVLLHVDQRTWYTRQHANRNYAVHCGKLNRNLWWWGKPGVNGWTTDGST